MNARRYRKGKSGDVSFFGQIYSMEFEKGYKHVADSLTEWSCCLQHKDINGTGRLYGGRLMEIIDEVAGIAAVRHCGGNVTTAAVDNLQFKHGAFLNDIIVVIAKLTYVGRTSMEVRVDTYVEDKETGMRRSINRAYFTEVCVDDNGRPIPVRYGLLYETESEKAEKEFAEKRRRMRHDRTSL